MSGIFISYRHEDSAEQAWHLWDRLASTFGAERVFIDAVSLEPGRDFAQSIREKVAFCDVLIAAIGPGWLDSATADGRRRLDDPEDWVRIEISAALDERVPVVPALVGGAVLPEAGRLPTALTALVRSQAIALRPQQFDTDVERLRTTLARVVTGGDVAASWLALLSRRHRALDPLTLERPQMLWRAFGFLVLMMLIDEALKLPAAMSAGLESHTIGFITAQIVTNSVSLVVVCFLSAWLPLISLSQAPVWGLHISVTRDMASAAWDPAAAAERMMRFVGELGRFGTVRLLLSFALATALWVVVFASLFTALRTLHGLGRARGLGGLGLGLSAEVLFLGFLYAPVTGSIYAAFGLGARS